MDAFGWCEITHGVIPWKMRPEQIVGARFDSDRLLGVGFVEYFDRLDLALGGTLDLHRPACRNITGFDPVIDDRAIQAEAPGHLGLAAKNRNQSFSAVHAKILS